jgi:hypothetical protein
MSTETTDTGSSSKTPEACRREAEEQKMRTAVEHGRAQIEQARPPETTVEHQQAEGAQLAGAKQSRRNTNTQGRIVYNLKESGAEKKFVVYLLQFSDVLDTSPCGTCIACLVHYRRVL